MYVTHPLLAVLEREKETSPLFLLIASVPGLILRGLNKGSNVRSGNLSRYAFEALFDCYKTGCAKRSATSLSLH